MTKRVIYGESNYAAIVHKGGYFVDKTAYINKLEDIANPIFLRPRRFGKSLFCSVFSYYYDLNYADQFDELFGDVIYCFGNQRFRVFEIEKEGEKV